MELGETRPGETLIRVASLNEVDTVQNSKMLKNCEYTNPLLLFVVGVLAVLGKPSLMITNSSSDR